MTEQKQPTQFEFTKLYWLQFWPFVLLSLIYIASEFLFNATIVDKVGGDKTDQHTIEFLDYFGRSISAFGLAFIVINLFRMNRLKVAQNISIIFTIILLIVYYFEPINIKIWLTPVLIFGVLSLYSLYRGRPKQSLAFKYVLFTGLFAWFSMFFGQKQIIDYLFIDNSSAEQRLLASKMALFKSGLARDIIRINGLPQRESKPINSPAEKAFLVMIGALLVNSDKAIETISGQEKRIIEKVELDLALEELDQRYKVYLSAGNNLKELYSSYASQSQQYETKRLNFSNQANEHWLDILNQIEQSWHVFLRSKYHTLLLIERDVNKFATDLAKYIEKRNHCINVDNLQCVNQADQQYSKKMNGRFRADHDVSHWCDNRDGGVKYNICQFSESNLRRKLEKQIIDDFEYKKYPITIESFSDYFQHPTTLNHVREELRVGKGIKLSNDWTLDDQSAFTTALVEKSGKKLRKKWDSEWKKKVGGTIEPKLSFEQFVASKTIKNYSKRNLKKANIDNVQYTKTEFYQKIIMPEVREKIVKKYNELKQEGHLYANGKAKEEEGKQSVRSIIIPPIAVFISLFFAIWNLVRLFLEVNKKLIYWIKKKWPKTTPSQRTDPSYTIPNVVIYSKQPAIVVTTLICIYSIKYFFTNEYSESSTFNYIVNQAKLNGGFIAMFSDWVVAVQPMFYLVGGNLKSGVEWFIASWMGEVFSFFIDILVNIFQALDEHLVTNLAKQLK